MNVPDVSPDLPPRTWRALLALLGRLPQGGLSRLGGQLADTALPRPVRRPVLGLFAKAMGIDVEEAERPLDEYRSLNELFVRRLREGARRWPDDPRVLASPVDGIAGRAGAVRDGRLVQAKGRWYSAAQLLDDAAAAARYDGGVFLTLYLSPRHYHRIHAPCGGAVAEARYVPGALLPVNAGAVAHVTDLFARNERLICYLDGPLGRVAVVAIGAYNVGRISAAFDPAWNDGQGRRRCWVTNRPGAAPETRRYAETRCVEQGEEIMAFHLGSTVVLLLEADRVALDPAVQAGEEVRLGQALAAAIGAGALDGLEA